MALTPATQDKIDAALVGHETVSAERKQILLQTVQCAFRRGALGELHQNFSEGLPAAELAFYQDLIVIPPDDATTAPATVPVLPAPAPEAAATAVTEGARDAKSHATRSRND